MPYAWSSTVEEHKLRFQIIVGDLKKHPLILQGVETVLPFDELNIKKTIKIATTFNQGYLIYAKVFTNGYTKIIRFTDPDLADLPVYANPENLDIYLKEIEEEAE